MGQIQSEEPRNNPHVPLFGDPKKDRWLYAVLLVGILIVFTYLFFKTSESYINVESEPDINVELVYLYWVVAGFVLGYLARSIPIYFFQPLLRIESKIHRFDEKFYIAVSNIRRADVIEIKVSFELAERKDGSGSLILKHAESIFLASVPGRKKKSGAGTIYVEVPQKFVKHWEKDGQDCNVMFVRATSVHPTTNFRTITNSAVFEWKTVACHPSMTPERSL